MTKYKSYKANTLFEKVKSGKIDNDFTYRRFSDISYFKKKEIIKPYIYSLDDYILKSCVSDHMLDSGIMKNNLFQRTLQYVNEIKKKESKPAIEKGKLFDDMKRIYQDFPKEVISDIFNQYSTDITKLRYEDRDEGNKYRYKFIDAANNPGIKVITKDSNVKSMIFTKNMLQYYISLLAITKAKSEEDYQKMMQSMKNGGGNSQDSNGDKVDGSPDPSEKMLDKLLDSKASEKLQQDAMDQAKNQTEMIQEMMSEEEMQQEWNSTGFGSGASKFNTDKIAEQHEKIQELSLNSDKLKPYLNKILDKSFSYFSGKEIPIYDEFLNNPEISEIMGYEFFHPKFKNVMLEDIQVKDSKKIGKIDVYIDVSTH